MMKHQLKDGRIFFCLFLVTVLFAIGFFMVFVGLLLLISLLYWKVDAPSADI